MDGVTAVLTTTDLVMCCTGATEAVLNVKQVSDARSDSSGPLVV